MARTTRLRGSLLVLVSLVPLLRWSQDALSALVQPKRPPSAYMLWLNKERPKIVEQLETNSVTEVGREAGKKWGKLAAKTKTPLEKEAAKLKKQYEKEKAAFLEQGGMITRKTKKEPKKPKRDPNAPKRPPSAYVMWWTDNQAKIAKKMPTGYEHSDLMRKAGEMWKDVGAKVKSKYEKKVEAEKTKYVKAREEYMKTLATAEPLVEAE